MSNFVRTACMVMIATMFTACGGGGDSGGGDSGEGFVLTPRTPDIAYSLGVGNANITRVGG